MGITGVKTFSTEGREVAKFDKTPPQAKDWDSRVDTGKWSIAVGKESKLPYIKAAFPLVGSANREGGKERWIYHNFFLDITPSSKDGKAMVDRQGGITEFAKAVATSLNLEGDDAIIDKARLLKDESGSYATNDEGEYMSEPCQLLNAKLVMQWLKQFDGMSIRFRSKVEKGTNGYADKGVIDYFIEADAQESSNDDAFTFDNNTAEESIDEAAEATEEVMEALEEDPVPAKKPVLQKSVTSKNGATKMPAALAKKPISKAKSARR